LAGRHLRGGGGEVEGESFRILRKFGKKKKKAVLKNVENVLKLKKDPKRRDVGKCMRCWVRNNEKKP
jgi:hypothetical protein